MTSWFWQRRALSTPAAPTPPQWPCFLKRCLLRRTRVGPRLGLRVVVGRGVDQKASS